MKISMNYKTVFIIIICICSFFLLNHLLSVKAPTSGVPLNKDNINDPLELIEICKNLRELEKTLDKNDPANSPNWIKYLEWHQALETYEWNQTTTFGGKRDAQSEIDLCNKVK